MLDITYREIGLLDNPWREIFLRWFDGKGDWENAPFGDYLMRILKLLGGTPYFLRNCEAKYCGEA